MLHRILESVRARKKEVVVAWLDLADAFGSVSHAVIRRALVDDGVPARVVDSVTSLYEGSTVRVRTRDGYTEAIPMLSGVRQGCPLSPILFDLVIDPLVRSAEELVAGFEVYGERMTALAYADDLALVAADPNSMGRLLRAAEVSARALGLSFNPRKCNVAPGGERAADPDALPTCGRASARIGAWGLLPPPGGDASFFRWPTSRRLQSWPTRSGF